VDYREPHHDEHQEGDRVQQDQHRQTDDADAAGRGEQQATERGGQQGTCESEQMGSLQWG